MVITVSTVAASSASPSLGRLHAARPSNANGLVTTATVSAFEFLGERRDHRRGAGAGAAAQTGGDEHHVRALQHLDDVVRVLQRRLPPDSRIGPGAQSVGHLRADCQLVAARTRR